MRHRGRYSRGAFSLIELLVTLLVVAILVGILVGVVGGLRARAQRLRCMSNLKSLSVAANLYVQQNGSWPQIPTPEPGGSDAEFAQHWIDALAPFGPTPTTWICPTMQNLMGNPDYLTAETARIDYIATPFDDKPATPHQWPRQPWFIETGDVHGHGNLIIFTDGSIDDLRNVIQQTSGGH